MIEKQYEKEYFKGEYELYKPDGNDEHLYKS